MSETSLFAELIKDRNRKEVEAKLAAAAKEQKNMNTCDIPMPASKESEIITQIQSDYVNSLSKDKTTLLSCGNDNTDFSKLESPKVNVLKKNEEKELNECDVTIIEGKCKEVNLEETLECGVHSNSPTQGDQSEQLSNNNMMTTKADPDFSIKPESDDLSGELFKKGSVTPLDNCRKGSFGETLKKAAQQAKIPKSNEKKLKRDNLKAKHGSLINRLPLPPGIKSTDLESVYSPPSRSPSPLPVENKKNSRSIKDLPLPPGKLTIF